MARKKLNKKWKQFRNLSEEEKDEILNWITRLGKPISSATKKFNLSLATINLIYETRYICERDKKIINQNEKNHYE